jgi:hypothetical protein
MTLYSVLTKKGVNRRWPRSECPVEASDKTICTTVKAIIMTDFPTCSSHTGNFYEYNFLILFTKQCS